MKQSHQAAVFSQLLISGTLVHEGDFITVQQEYGVYIQPNTVMVISIDRYPDLAKERPIGWRTEIGQALVDTVSKTTQDLNIPCIWVWSEEGVLAVLCEVVGPHAATDDGRLQIVRAAQAIQQQLAGVSICASIGIGSRYDNPYLLHHSFTEAIQSMSGRFFQGNQLIFEYHNDTPTDELKRNLLADEKTELLALMQMGEERGVVSELVALLEEMADVCGRNEYMFKSEVVDLMMLMSRTAVESGVSAADVLSANARFVHELYVTIRYDKFVRKVCDYVQWLTVQNGHAHMPKVSPVIREAIEYIKQNHRRHLLLDEIARSCCLSKYHLSHVFKREVGMGVIDFLNHVRVEKALYYLKTSDLPVQQIANQVGFQDANYFSRIFKKYVGCSPKDYRNARLC